MLVRAWGNRNLDLLLVGMQMVQALWRSSAGFYRMKHTFQQPRSLIFTRKS